MEKVSNARSSPSADFSLPSKFSRSEEEPAQERSELSSAKRELPRSSQRAPSARPSLNSNAGKTLLTSRDIKFLSSEENSLNLPELNLKSDCTSI